MKRLVAAMVIGLAAALGAAGSSFAQPYGRPGFPGGGGFPGGQGFPGKGPPPQTVPARQVERDRAAPPGRPPERLSPEERQQLRRDIEQHGREIYPDPRRGGGRR